MMSFTPNRGAEWLGNDNRKTMMNVKNYRSKNAFQKRHGFAQSIFQVEAPVTRRSPHRPGREDFPHPVPRFIFFFFFYRI